MDEIEFEEPEFSICECCGRTITRLTRFVTRDGGAYAVYYVEFTEGHEQRRAAAMVGLGDWDEGAAPQEARVAFTFHIWFQRENYQVSLIDPDDSPWSTGFLGRRVSRADALGSVDSRDSGFRRSMIQDCFLGGGLGCDGSFGSERHRLGSDVRPDHRPT
jgi:hypothetical protein